MNRVFVIFILCCAAFLQFGCSSAGKKSGTAAPDTSPATPMSAADLIEAYRMEKADGAGKYKGQRLAVTGTVSRKGKDYLERLYVDLKTPANSVMEVHCTYQEEQEEAMAALKPGQDVTIKGICDGRLSTWVVLKDSVPQ